MDFLQSVATIVLIGMSIFFGGFMQQTEQGSLEGKVPIHTMTTQTHEPDDHSSKAQEDITTMLVAGGCFWCVEADLEKLTGVIEVIPGYAGGTTTHPTYETYKAGGHREVVEVTFDARQISFEEILIVALKTTDPTDDNGTFYDRGNGYSPAMYYETEAERQTIERLIAEVNERGPYQQPLAIDIEKRPPFWPAEAYHQNYYQGTLSQLKYQYYRQASGRDDFIAQHWDKPHVPTFPWRETPVAGAAHDQEFWHPYSKPTTEELKRVLSPLAYKVTQEEGTEPAGTSPLNDNEERGIYVDVLSGEPLFSSRDKFDSGTGWPSFVTPITPAAVTEHQDNQLFMKRTEVRSRIADNHLGHVFTDGPPDQGGLRYCMNGVALEFVPEADMVERGYQAYLSVL